MSRTVVYVVGKSKRNVGLWTRSPARPRPEPRQVPVSARPGTVFFEFENSKYAMHEKDLQIQKASFHWSPARNEEQVSSCGYVNRTSPGYQPDVLFFHLSNPKPGNTTDGSGRGGARRRGGAGRIGAGRDAGGCVQPGDNRPSCLPGVRRQLFERLFRSTNKRNHM